MNTKLKQKAKNNFAEDFFKLMNNAGFRKNHGKCEKVQKYLASKNRMENKLFSIKTKLS